MQAAWVALREVIHLDVANIEERLAPIQHALEKYKDIRLNQVLLKQEMNETVPLKESEM